LATAKRDLNLLMGQPQKQAYQVEKEVMFETMLQLETLLDKAKNGNVGLLQRQKNIDIAKYQVKRSQSGYLPKIDLNSSYGWNKSQNPSTSFAAGIESTGFNAGINLTWNLFDGGRSKTAIDNARLSLDNQKIAQQQDQETVEISIRNLWESYQNNLFVVAAQEDNVKTNQDSFDRTVEQNKFGRVTSLEFRQAQINLLNAKTALNNAKYDAKLMVLDLRRLSGELLNIDF
jgi:outer membrane protein TolC